MKHLNTGQLVPVVLLAGGLHALADVRRSEDVRILSDFVGTAGGVSKSQAGAPSVEIVSAIGTLGGGISSGGTQVIKSGYAGSLFEVTALTLLGDPASIEELTETSRLSGIATYDDGTTALVKGADVVWTGNTSPLNAVVITGTFPDPQFAEVSGLEVSQTAFGTVTGYYLDPSITAEATIEVRNAGDPVFMDLLDYDGDGTGPDGLDDNFQRAFFGDPPNLDAIPSADPDGDGDDNASEELTGHNPTDSTSYFRLRVIDHVGNAVSFEIDKALPGRTYTLFRGPDLTAFPDPVGAPFTVPAEEVSRALQDPSATDPAAYYRVEVTRP